jgi:hypothetical protein
MSVRLVLLAMDRLDRRLQILVALIGFAGALCGATVGGCVSLLAINQELDQRRDKATRSERARVYPEFVRAVKKAERAIAAIPLPCRPPRCRPAVAAWDRARADFDRAAEQILVFGSERAFELSHRMRTALGQDRIHYDDGHPKSLAGGVLLEFQMMMCRELNAQPRENCDEREP